MSNARSALVIPNTTATSPQVIPAAVIANQGILNQTTSGALTLNFPGYLAILEALSGNAESASGGSYTLAENFKVNQEFVFQISNNGSGAITLAASSDGTVTPRATPTSTTPGTSTAFAAIAAGDTKTLRAVVNYVYSPLSTSIAPVASAISIY